MMRIWIALWIPLIMFSLDAQLLEAVKQNPALLDTPQAKEYMQKHQKDVAPNVATTVVQKASNTIEDTTNSSQKTVVQEEILPVVETKPLAYQSTGALIDTILDKQAKVEKQIVSRYGEAFFANRNKVDLSSLPVPSWYAITPNDQLTIWIYGDKNEKLDLTVDNEGNLNLPTYGPLHIAGLSFAETKDLLIKTIKQTNENSSITVNLSGYSTIQVTLAGYAKNSGLFNLSSLSSVKDLLIAAGGFLPYGSMRDVELQRDGKTVAMVDFYEIMNKGYAEELMLLKNGDVVIVKKSDTVVSLGGEVNAPALFDVTKDETLSNIIQFAGGLKPSSNPDQIVINRYTKNMTKQTLIIKESEAKTFKLQNGDEIIVKSQSEIYHDKFYLYGNVVYPGAKMYPAKGSLQNFFEDQIAQYGKEGTFLTNTHFNYALVKTQDNLQDKIYSFDLEAVLSKTVDVTIQLGDKVFIFNRLEMEANPFVEVTGSVLQKPGELKFVEGMTLEDAINQVGLKTKFIDTEYIKVVSYDKDFIPLLHFYTLEEAKKVTLQPFDRVEVFPFSLRNPFQYVKIAGEVHLPNTYQLAKSMTLKQLVDMAGGLTDKAMIDHIEIGRYEVVNNERKRSVISMPLNEETMAKTELMPYDEVTIFSLENWNELRTVAIFGEISHPNSYTYGDNMKLKDIIVLAGGFTDRASKDAVEIIRYSIEKKERKRNVLTVPLTDYNLEHTFLMPYDEITVFKIPKWNERKTVKIYGQVKYPGEYVIQDGDRLADLLVRIGGYTSEANLYGAIYLRDDVKKMQQKRLKQMAARLEKKAKILMAEGEQVGENQTDKKLAAENISQVVQESEEIEALGRISINLDKPLQELIASHDNILLQDKDEIYIPQKDDTVSIIGEVLNPMAVVYSGKNLQTYLQKSGGLSDMADEEYIFVVHANGQAQRYEQGWFAENDVDIRPGDVIVVPLRIDTYSDMKAAKDVTSILYQLAVTAASLKTLGTF